MIASTTTLVTLLLSMDINTATATNIHAFSRNSCSGGAYQSCNNIKNDVCCGIIHGTSGAVSGQFTGLPGNSRFLGYQTSRSGSNCGTVVGDHTGSGNKCITLDKNTGQYSGFLWAHASGKRFEGGAECTGTQAADTITLEDGTVYDLWDMADHQMAQLWELAANGTKQEEVHAGLAKFAHVS